MWKMERIQMTLLCIRNSDSSFDTAIQISDFAHFMTGFFSLKGMGHFLISCKKGCKFYL